MKEILHQIEMMFWEISHTSTEQWPVDPVHVADVGHPMGLVYLPTFTPKKYPNV